ncbi:MAG: [LysW]-lysine hydrolase [Chloroflexota bacterium]
MHGSEKIRENPFNPRHPRCYIMNAVEFLREFVTIRSLSGEEQAAAEFAVARMAALGLTGTHVDAAGNTVGVKERPLANGDIEREIVLLGHIDTVPGEIEVRVENGRLYGRGSVDAKGPFATFIEATARADLKPGTRIVVIGATEEEAATSKGARYVRDRHAPDFCIIGEPSGWDGVTLGYKGRLLIDYTLEKEMGHTAGPEIGAAETAVNWWNQLTSYIADFNTDHPRLFDQLIPSLRDMASSSDGLHNKAFLKVGVRLPPDFDVAAFENLLRDWAGNAHIRTYAGETAYQSTRSTPLARAFNRALRQQQVRPRFKLKTGTSDMNVVGPVWQCPIVAYGPGDSQLDHTPHEHVVIDDYLQAIDILQTVLESL